MGMRRQGTFNLHLKVFHVVNASSSSTATRVTPTIRQFLLSEILPSLVVTTLSSVITTLDRPGVMDNQPAKIEAFQTLYLDTSQNQFRVLFTSISAHGYTMTNL